MIFDSNCAVLEFVEPSRGPRSFISLVTSPWIGSTRRLLTVGDHVLQKSMLRALSSYYLDKKHDSVSYIAQRTSDNKRKSVQVVELAMIQESTRLQLV